MFYNKGQILNVVQKTWCQLIPVWKKEINSGIVGNQWILGGRMDGERERETGVELVVSERRSNGWGRKLFKKNIQKTPLHFSEVLSRRLFCPSYHYTLLFCFSRICFVIICTVLHVLDVIIFGLFYFWSGLGGFTEDNPLQVM